MKNKLINEIINKTHDIITDVNFKNESRISDKYFTRVRKMSFVKIVTFILNFLSKSLQLELDKYFENTDSSAKMSQQAFSKARQHIKPEAFKKLFKMTAEESMNSKEIKRYKGYRVFAIDGTEIYLEPTKELVTYYGRRAKEGCKARVSILCEVNNGIIIESEIDTFKIGERTLAIRHLEEFEKIKQEKDLIIFDRGYPSSELIEILDNKSIKYLMRLQRNNYREIQNNKEKDFYVTIGKSRVRVVKVILDTGEEEILITNLKKEEFKAKEFKELYFKRWGIETKYDLVKNKLKLQIFSGKTKTAVLQDFYATMYLANIVSISKITCNEEINKNNMNKKLKYKYQVNESMLISKLKDKFILAFLIEDIKKREKIINQILNEAIEYRLPIKPNRHYGRLNKSSHGKKKTPRRYIKSVL